MAVRTKIPVNVPGLSSFDKSYKNILTTKVGTITPICSRFLIPNSKGSLKLAISAALPPLASDTFMRCDLKVEAFFVPLRLLYGGFESFLTGKKLTDYGNSLNEVVAAMPRIVIKYSEWSSQKPLLEAGTLCDYLGGRIDTSVAPASGDADKYLNLTKFLCYHRIFDDWYRNPKIQRPVFVQPVDINTNSYVPLSSLPYYAMTYMHDFRLSDTFNDGFYLGSLRQRNYGDDYFTICTPSAQVGNAQSIDTTSGSFTIAALRAGNSLQQFAERSNLGSPRLVDYYKTHYGADLSSGVAQRAVLLGSATYPVYSKGIEANAANTATNNPFTSVGARYGNAYAAGTDFVCNFNVQEMGYLFVNATLVPEANYSYGLDKELTMFIQAGSQTDIPDPLLENVGNEPVYSSELDGHVVGTSRSFIFGYVPRFTHHKTGLNEVHGLLRAGESLASFVAQRAIIGGTQPPQINSAFLTIPRTALDNVTAVTADLSNYGVWIDSFVDLKVAEPLVESAMPSLQDPAYEHGKTEYVQINGSRL